MGNIVRNIVATSRKEKPFFISNFNDEEPFKTIESVTRFTNELITEGLLWSSKIDSREIMTAGLDFYNVVSILIYRNLKKIFKLLNQKKKYFNTDLIFFFSVKQPSKLEIYQQSYYCLILWYINAFFQTAVCA